MKFFIVVDMQNDFCTGALKNESAVKIIDGIKEMIHSKKKEGYIIIGTKDTHFDDYLNTAEGKQLPVPHCIKGTPGHEIVDELKDLMDYTFEKVSFGSNTLSDQLLTLTAGEGVEAIDMCGTCTAICVASNYAILKSEFPETPITVHEKLCACITEESHEQAINTMKMQQAIIK